MFVIDAVHNYEDMSMTMQILNYLRHSIYYEENERNYDMGCLKKYPFVKPNNNLVIDFHSNYSTYYNESCTE